MAKTEKISTELRKKEIIRREKFEHYIDVIYNFLIYSDKKKYIFEDGYHYNLHKRFKTLYIANKEAYEGGIAFVNNSILNPYRKIIIKPSPIYYLPYTEIRKYTSFKNYLSDIRNPNMMNVRLLKTPLMCLVLSDNEDYPTIYIGDIVIHSKKELVDLFRFALNKKIAFEDQPDSKKCLPTVPAIYTHTTFADKIDGERY